MKIDSFEDYIYTTQLDIDNAKMLESCNSLRDTLMTEYPDGDYDLYQSYHFGPTDKPLEVSKRWLLYNVFAFPYEPFYDLYMQTQSMFKQVNKNYDKHKYYFRCWMNYYKTDEWATWHSHRWSFCDAWIGLYCVNVDPDSGRTTYELPTGTIYDLKNTNDMLVMTKSEGDKHRTHPWKGFDPRITIAMDIVPQQCIYDDKYGIKSHDFNTYGHWMPI